LIATIVAMRWTRIGILLAAAGDDPEVAALRGVDAKAVRALALAFAGVMVALGGAAITIGFYSDGVTTGRGYVAIAVVIIGRWTPAGATLGALLFAFFDSLRLRVEGRPIDWSNEVFGMAPYLVTLVILIFTARANVAPRKLGELLAQAQS
jgi:simple sugar transport system permease protein